MQNVGGQIRFCPNTTALLSGVVVAGSDVLHG